MVKLPSVDMVEKELNPDGTRARTDWKSIYVLSIVTFLGAMQSGAIGPTVWPYIKVMDPTVPDTFSGYFRSLNSLGHVIAAVLAGYCSNKLNQTKTPMMIGNLLVILASILYLSNELMTSGRRYIFVVYEFLMGFALGSLLIGRVFIAMASTEKDRPRAISISNMAMPFGLALGPLFQLFFTLFGYPGTRFLFGVHLNIYTSPIYLSILSCFIGILLLAFFFHAKLQLTKAEKREDFYGNVKLDKLAIIVCLITRLMLGFVMIFNMTVGPPYTMMVFRWTPSEAVLYGSIVTGVIGVIAIGINFLYLLTSINKLLPERRAILLSFTCFFTFFFITFPWSFIRDTIEYQTTANSSLGCKLTYSWCEYTPRVNVWVYNVVQVLCMGLGMPLMMINLDTLYSKILGPIKQGTMQGVFMVCGEILNIAGPILMSNVYAASGPRYIWITEMVVLFSGFTIWIFLYRRMISFSQRISGELK